MVDSGEAQNSHIGEEPGQDAGLHRLLVVREIAVAVEDGKRGSPQKVAFETVGVECLQQRGDARRPFLHLGRYGAWRWWGKGRPRLDLLAHEGGHELIAVKS